MPLTGLWRRGARSSAVLLLIAFTAACAPPDPETPAPPAAAATSGADAARSPAGQAADARGEDLAGTSWRLVNILSMDGTVFTPEDPAAYTLEFDAEGAAEVQADCNRARGSWASEAPGQLQFGPLAATRAACPPGSLHDRYLGQFEWVRSYVLRDGHLFLATFADGAIIEFEPVE